MLSSHPAVFVDAPMVALPVDLDGTTANASGDSNIDSALLPRIWYKTNPDRSVAKGLEDALLMLKAVLLRDRYVVSLDSHVFSRVIYIPLGHFWLQVSCGCMRTGFIVIISIRLAKVRQWQLSSLHWYVR